MAGNGGRFRLLHGMHVQSNKEGTGDEYFTRGQIIESETDLCTLNGGQGMTPRFERLDVGKAHPPDGEVWNSKVETLDQFTDRMRALQQVAREAATAAQQPAPVPGLTSPAPTSEQPIAGPPKSKEELLQRLQSQTVEQLREVAAEEEIDLRGATNKATIIRTIYDALTSA